MDTSIPLQASPKVRYQQGCAQPKCATPTATLTQIMCYREQVYYCEEHWRTHQCQAPPPRIFAPTRFLDAKEFESFLNTTPDIHLMPYDHPGWNYFYSFSEIAFKSNGDAVIKRPANGLGQDYLDLSYYVDEYHVDVVRSRVPVLPSAARCQQAGCNTKAIAYFPPTYYCKAHMEALFAQP